VLLRGTKLCITESLQKQTVLLSHKGHQGQTKCRILLASTNEYNGGRNVKHALFANVDYSRHYYLESFFLKSVVTSCDFCGRFPDGYMLLATVDFLSLRESNRQL
jgi:hypothetical protein